MPRPSLDAVNATLVLRRWTRSQQDVTGKPIDPDLLRHRVERFYPKLSDHDKAYVVEHSVPPIRQPWRG